MIRQSEKGNKTIARVIAAAVFACISFAGLAQQSTDTLLQAVELHKQADYKRSYELLSQYRQSHKADVNAEWLLGQAAFNLGKKKEMMSVYEANIAANSANYYLRLDYAFKLVEVGELHKAQAMLKQYLPYDTANAQIYASLAKIDYWQSNYRSALANADNAVRFAPDNQQYKDFRNNIKRSMSPWVGASADYSKDNQPLQVITPTIEGGMYFSSLLAVRASVQTQLLHTDTSSMQATIFTLGNTSVFARQGLKVRLGAGATAYPDGTIRPTGLVGLDQTVLRSLTLTAQAERRAYLSMLGSLDTAIATNNYLASATWMPEKGFMGQAAYSATVFGDKNVVSTASAWLVSPELKLWRFGFRTGYGYSRTDSKRDMLVPVQPQSELMTSIYFNNNVAGKFDPYLTPSNQQVHSIIGVATFAPVQRVKLQLSGSYGFNASIDTPYLIGYYTAESEAAVAKYYYTEDYTTLDLSARADVAITRNLSAKAEFHRSSPNFYYTSNYASIGLKMILGNGK